MGMILGSLKGIDLGNWRLWLQTTVTDWWRLIGIGFETKKKRIK
ncbi:hypothetical protein HanXRQr2_Chr07g0300091 [Helianthus annuus]|uniref:Uncharacterized protein n=1 Tax=Helianthus annuus TaxID=4232 RepID=A0A9K3ILA0_HELAN|nr:hypothetical protein HanXRQr2_Chr07g0300091 [Helianthus annuus]